VCACFTQRCAVDANPSMCTRDTAAFSQMVTCFVAVSAPGRVRSTSTPQKLVLAQRPTAPRLGAFALRAKRRGHSRLSRPVSAGSDLPRRPSRVAEQIRRDLAEIFLHELVTFKKVGKELVPPTFRTKDISVLEVSVTSDLRTAQVEISVLSAEPSPRSCVEWLMRNRWEIRHALAQRMRHQKFVPELRFRESRVPQVMRTLQLIDRLAAERRGRESTATEDPEIMQAAASPASDFETDDTIRPEELFLSLPPAKPDAEETDILGDDVASIGSDFETDNRIRPEDLFVRNLPAETDGEETD
jgi:ribosome-binding factor A